MGVRYPLISKKDSRAVRVAIRKVFVEVWDPIGVMKDPDWPRDEYDGYVGSVFEILATGGSDKEIEAYLLWATDRMGMDGSRVSLQTVIAALRQIQIPNR